MTKTPCPTPSTQAAKAAKAALKRDFPDWNILVSAQGGWWAQLRPPHPREHCPDETMLNAKTAEDLRKKLAAVTG